MLTVKNYFSYITKKQIQMFVIPDLQDTIWSLQKLAELKTRWMLCISHPKVYETLHTTDHVTTLYGPCGGVYFRSSNTVVKYWILQLPAGLGLNFTLIYFEMRYSGKACELNALSFYALTQNQTRLIDKLCGKRPPFAVFLHENNIKLHLDSAKLEEPVIISAVYQIQSKMFVTSFRYFQLMTPKEFDQQIGKLKDSIQMNLAFQLLQVPHLTHIDQNLRVFSWQIFYAVFDEALKLVTELLPCEMQETSLFIYTGPRDIR